MIRNIIGILFVVGLLVPTLTAGVSPQYEGILDQGTPDDEIGCAAYSIELAQGFKPTLPVLTEVELGLMKAENVTGEFEVSIRRTLKGENLVTNVMSVEDLPYRSFRWILIDFDNLEVVPNRKYFIVVSPRENDNVCWFQAQNAPYKQGFAWVHISHFGKLEITPWLPSFLIFRGPIDWTFRTYGLVE